MGKSARNGSPPNGEKRSWLHAIVVNACLDRIRRNKTRRAVSLSPETMPEPKDTRDNIAELEMSLVIDRALFTLPEEQRAALERWRLVLGEPGQSVLAGGQLSEAGAGRDAALDWLSSATWRVSSTASGSSSGRRSSAASAKPPVSRNAASAPGCTAR